MIDYNKASVQKVARVFGAFAASSEWVLVWAEIFVSAWGRDGAVKIIILRLKGLGNFIWLQVACGIRLGEAS